MAHTQNYQCEYEFSIGDFVILKKDGKVYEILDYYPMFRRINFRYSAHGEVIKVQRFMEPYYFLKGDTSSDVYAERTLKRPSKKLLKELEKERLAAMEFQKEEGDEE